MTKARRSVRDVIVMPIPAERNVMPILAGILLSLCGYVSAQLDINRNMSSTPIPRNIDMLNKVRFSYNLKVDAMSKLSMNVTVHVHINSFCSP